MAGRIAPFLLVIVDDDRHLFSVVGQMTDDTSWNQRVCDAQDRGRGMRCHTPGRSQTRDEVINGAVQMGLKNTADVLV